MPYRIGDVVLVRFPLTNQTAFKQRPAVGIRSREYNISRPDVVIAAVTSQVRLPLSIGEIPVLEWQAANLLKESMMKPVFATVEQASLLRAFGARTQADSAALRQRIGSVLK